MLFLLLLTFSYSNASPTHIVAVFGYPDEGVQWLYTYPGVDVKFCWDVLQPNSTYDFGFYAENGTCYLTAYQFVSQVFQGSSEDGRIVGFRVNGDTCLVGENPPTYNNTNISTPYHTISWNAQNTSWNIDPNSGCEEGYYWSIRGDQIVCYTFAYLNYAQTYSQINSSRPSNTTLTSPISMTTVAQQLLGVLDPLISGTRAVTDGKRKDSCNTVEMINTTACQYPDGFDFMDKSNPMHSYYTWVDQPRISIDLQCVGIGINRDTTKSDNGKLDYFSCEEVSPGLFFKNKTSIIHLTASTHLVIVYGDPGDAVQWLYTYPGVKADYCWETLYSNSTYDIGFYSKNGTCYLTAYQFISRVYKGSSENGWIVGFRVNGDTCLVGENPPTFNNTVTTTPYHTISYSESLGYWTVAPITKCGGEAWSIRGDKIVCYMVKPFSSAVTYTSAQTQLQGYKLSSPINTLSIISNTHSALFSIDAGRTLTKALVLTDGKRNDSCNIAEMINTSACQYPDGFTFLDDTNPMHSYYTWVDQPQISIDRQCVGSYINLNSSYENNAKFNFFPCEACDNGYCYYLAFVIIT